MRYVLALFALFGLLCGNAHGAAPSRRVVEEMRRADSLEAVAEKSERGLEALLMLACFQLRLHGHEGACQKLKEEWQGGMRRRYRWAVVDTEGLGDHQPLSIWLAGVYLMLENYLGSNLLELLHLDDINVFNYSVPVVRDPHEGAAWCQELPLTPCKEEYAEHFVPLSGVAAYWVAWATCTGATWGMGAVAMLCSPVGMLTEKFVVVYVGPKLSAKVWARANPSWLWRDDSDEPEPLPDTGFSLLDY